MIHGLTELRDALKAISKRGLEAAEAAVEAQGKYLTDASRDMTPVDTGALQDSHVLMGPYFYQGGAKIRFVVEAGGWLAPYAIYVHEDLSKRHLTGSAKFMERAILRHQKTYAAIWENTISQRLAL